MGLLTYTSCLNLILVSIIHIHQVDLWSRQTTLLVGLFSLVGLCFGLGIAGNRLKKALVINLLVFFASWSWFNFTSERPKPWQDIKHLETVVQGYVDELPKKVGKNWYFVWKLIDEQTPDNVFLSQAKIAVKWPHSSWLEVIPGQIWKFHIQLQPVSWSATPGTKDLELRYWENHILLQGIVLENTIKPELIAATSRYAWLHQWRYQVTKLIQKHVTDPRVTALLVSLTTGQQNAISTEDWELFQKTGIAHLISISGMHVTLLALWLRSVLNFVLPRIRFNQYWLALYAPLPVISNGLCLFMATFYAIFSGWGLPSQRTIWTLSLALAISYSGRLWSRLHILGLAFVVSIGLEPLSIAYPGYWLSYYSAVFLVMQARPTANNALFVQKTSWLDWILSFTRTQWWITLALIPLSIYYFQQIPLIGLVANFFAIPLISYVIVPFSLIGIALPIFWDSSWIASECLFWILDAVVDWPLANIYIAEPPIFLVLTSSLALCILILRFPWSWRIWALSGVLPIFFWKTPKPLTGQFDIWQFSPHSEIELLVRTSGFNVLLRESFKQNGILGEHKSKFILQKFHESVEITLPLTPRYTEGSRSLEADITSCNFVQRWPPYQLSLTGLVFNNHCLWQLQSQNHLLFMLLKDTSSRLLGNQLMDRLINTFNVDTEKLQQITLVWLSLEGMQVLVKDLRPPLLEPNNFNYNELNFKMGDCGALRWDSVNPTLMRCHKHDIRRFWSSHPADFYK
ncbi:MAG: ComEC/Rec2 family competence protein [Gammaproteobacteria bacterium]|nr:ComEC/Rec2 family competence protein [Gammaproteobacteria bacterium]